MRALGLVEEDGVLHKCVLDPSQCSEEKPCLLQHRYKKVKPELLRMFEGTTIGQQARDLENEAVFLSNTGMILQKETR